MGRLHEVVCTKGMRKKSSSRTAMPDGRATWREVSTGDDTDAVRCGVMMGRTLGRVLLLAVFARAGPFAPTAETPLLETPGDKDRLALVLRTKAKVIHSPSTCAASNLNERKRQMASSFRLTAAPPGGPHASWGTGLSTVTRSLRSLAANEVRYPEGKASGPPSSRESRRGR